MKEDTIGVITEQNDFGLGFDELNESEQEAARRRINSDKKEEKDKK